MANLEEMSNQIAVIEKRLEQIEADNNLLREEVRANTILTQEVKDSTREAIHLIKNFSMIFTVGTKSLILLGTTVRWLAGIIAAIGIIWATFTAWRNGLPFLNPR